MKVRTSYLTVRREGPSEEESYRKVYIREPMKDNDGEVLRSLDGAWRFAPKSELWAKTLLSYLKRGIVVDVPKSLVEDVQVGFTEYVDNHPAKCRDSIYGMRVCADVTGTFYDLDYPSGRLQQLRTYLAGYCALKRRERARSV